jgi:hypothetical protein
MHYRKWKYWIRITFTPDHTLYGQQCYQELTDNLLQWEQLNKQNLWTGHTDQCSARNIQNLKLHHKLKQLTGSNIQASLLQYTTQQWTHSAYIEVYDTLTTRWHICAQTCYLREQHHLQEVVLTNNSIIIILPYMVWVVDRIIDKQNTLYFVQIRPTFIKETAAA